MLACSSYLRKASSLVSPYLKTTSIMLRGDPITKPPLFPRVSASSSFSYSSSSSKKHYSPSSPWLMLTPEIELSSGTETVFKFYTLAEDKVISVNRKNLIDQLGLESEEEVDLECRGSSHGWLVLLDRCSSDLFLYNPLSNRHLKLPTIRKLEAFRKDFLEDGFLRMTKVIISSSDPEGDENCRALMIHGDDDNLAFCCPKSSDEWFETYHRYNDVVCGDNDSMLFFGVDDSVRPYYYPEFEGWDLKDVSRPMLISLEDRLSKDFVGKRKGYSSFKKPAWRRWREANFLVPAADGDKNMTIYYVCLLNGGNNKLYLSDEEEGDYHFHVHKFDFESGKLVRMDRSLDGLAFFVGGNHSFALSAAEFPELESNSIYFTHPEDSVDDEPFGRKHIKAYNYEDRTFSPPFYTFTESFDQCVIKKSPIWYTPT